MFSISVLINPTNPNKNITQSKLKANENINLLIKCP